MKGMFRNLENRHKLVGNKNDWDGLPNEELSRHQRLAKNTGGVLDVANGATAAGLGLFAWGVQDIVDGHPVIGGAKIIAGRMMDWWDGWLAERFKVKGRTGKYFDHGVDFLELVGVTLVLDAEGLLPDGSVDFILGAKGLELAAVSAALLRGKELNPSAKGKVLGNVMLAGVISTAVLRMPAAESVPDLVWLPAYMGSAAMLGYGAIGKVLASGYMGVGFGNEVQC